MYFLKKRNDIKNFKSFSYLKYIKISKKNNVKNEFLVGIIKKIYNFCFLIEYN